jgi:DNA polymerase-4
LAKNQIAKKYGVTTGEALWQAKQKCPQLVIIRPHYDRYLRFSALARQIYNSYTDQVESFGLDECWLDVSGSVHLFGDSTVIAEEIRERVKRELGITVSVGVSYNKVFAKLGSDLKKPGAVRVLTRDNYQDKVWPLFASDLLYVGWATTRKLLNHTVLKPSGSSQIQTRNYCRHGSARSE